MNPEDPFLEVQADVQSVLRQTRHLFSSYLRIRTLASNATSPELIQSRAELTTNLETLATDLSDLLESIRAVESDPYKFGLDVAEVGRRRAFCVDVSKEVGSMSQEIKIGVGGANNGSVSNGLPNPDSFDDGRIDDDDAYEAFETQQQETIMRDQDEQLDGVFHTVGVLRGQAEDMGRELEEQDIMLDEVDTLADRVGGKLTAGTKKITEVLKRNEDKYSSCCIAGLIVVLIILLILVIII